MITVTLVGPDKVRSIVKIREETTVRDVATSNYNLFWRTTKRNGVSIVLFATRVVDGDAVTVEVERMSGQWDREKQAPRLLGHSRAVALQHLLVAVSPIDWLRCICRSELIDLRDRCPVVGGQRPRRYEQRKLVED